MGPRSGSLVCLVALLAACGRDEAPPAAAPPTVIVATAEQRELPGYQEWVGTILGLNDASIRPRIQGYLLERHYQEGQPVQKDEKLFSIDPRPFRAALEDAQGKLRQAEAARDKARLDVQRFRPLVAQGAVSQRELDDAIQAELGGAASVASAQAIVEDATLNLQWTEVRSPIEGVAGLSKAQIGDLVGPTTELTAVSQLDPVRVRFPISEREYLAISQRRAETGKAAGEMFLFSLVLADETVWDHPGTLLAANQEIGKETGTLLVDASFPNPGNVLRPGQYARVRAETQERTSAIVVPKRAIQQLQGVDQIAVVGDGDKIEFRNVTLGATRGDVRVVEKGLAAGERVVVEGFLKVRPGMVVTPQPVSAPAAGEPAKSTPSSPPA
jgi:membrane fusion protein (multidrug efflux system)